VSLVRGEVVLVSFPNSDLTTFKKRPALVVQDNSVYTGLSQLILALITSNLSRMGATRVRVDAATTDGRVMGLVTDSVIVTDNLATVSTRAILKSIGKCKVMDQVDKARKTTLGLK
jgi:mRNA interferase MazF